MTTMCYSILGRWEYPADLDPIGPSQIKEMKG